MNKPLAALALLSSLALNNPATAQENREAAEEMNPSLWGRIAQVLAPRDRTTSADAPSSLGVFRKVQLGDVVGPNVRGAEPDPTLESGYRVVPLLGKKEKPDSSILMEAKVVWPGWLKGLFGDDSEKASIAGAPEESVQ